MRPLCHTLSNALNMSKNTPRTSSSNDLCISWAIERSWWIHESPGLNPDYLWDIKSFFVKKFKHYTIFFQIFFRQWEAEIWGGSFSVFSYLLFYVQELHLLFFHSKGNFPLSRHDLGINSSGLQRQAPQSFTIRILIIWPWALFGSRFLIVFKISSLVKRIVDSDPWVFFVKFVGRLLQEFNKEHSFAEKVLNISFFF